MFFYTSKVLLQKIIEEILIKKVLLLVKCSFTENYGRNLDQKGSFNCQRFFYRKSYKKSLSKMFFYRTLSKKSCSKSIFLYFKSSGKYNLKIVLWITFWSCRIENMKGHMSCKLFCYLPRLCQKISQKLCKGCYQMKT